MSLFSRLGRLHGLTLFFVSHHLEHALAHADRILGLRHHTLALDTASACESVGSLRGFYA